MRIKKIYYTSHFAKGVLRLPKNVLTEVKKREKLFRKNPFDPKLKTHKLKGKLKRQWSFSISRKYRILFEFVKKDEVLFFDIGTHEIYR